MPALIRNGETDFITAVADADDVGGLLPVRRCFRENYGNAEKRYLVFTALEGSVVSSSPVVGIRRIEVAITGLSVFRESAVAAIDGVEEVVQETILGVVVLGWKIIRLAIG